MLASWERRRAARRVKGLKDAPATPVVAELQQIEHIVVLMMENHSFDCYLGLRRTSEGFTLDPATGKPTNSVPDPDGAPVVAHEITSQVPSYPSQSWAASHQQYADGANTGFVASERARGGTGESATIGMGYFTPEHLPFYSWLTDTFTVADHWFASCLGPTFPNRRFLIAGTANGLIDDQPYGLFDYPRNGTVLDQLTAAGISWTNYHNVTPLGVNAKRLFGAGGLAAARRVTLAAAHVFPGLAKNAVGNLQFTTDLYPMGLLRSLNHLRTLTDFFTDADKGTLPAFSIVDPDFQHFSEENAQDVQRGEAFAREVITRVINGPAWSKTLLLWIYDEHGGYYDHVPPPPATPPDDVPGVSSLNKHPLLLKLATRFAPDKVTQLDTADAGVDTYDRYGFRVPAVIVSPYSRPGQRDSTFYDHTSVLKLLQKRFGLPALTARDAAATAPTAALDLTQPPALLNPRPIPAAGLPWPPPDETLHHPATKAAVRRATSPLTATLGKAATSTPSSSIP